MENNNIENMKDETITLWVFKKNVHHEGVSKDGKKYNFDSENIFGVKPKGKKTITIRFSNDIKDRIALTEGVKFPIELQFKESQGFLTDEPYENAEGIELMSTILVITDFVNVKNAVIEKRSISKFLDGEEE